MHRYFRNQDEALRSIVEHSWTILRLAEFAEARHGFGDSNRGSGIIYPDDLDDYERAQGRSIPEGHVEAYDRWGPPDGYEFQALETDYLAVLAQVLREKGHLAEADRALALRSRLLSPSYPIHSEQPGPSPGVVIAHHPDYSKVGRILISIVAWVLSLPGLAVYLVLAYSTYAALFAFPQFRNDSLAPWPIYPGVVMGCAAWAMLMWLNWRWLRDRPLHRRWPLLGMALGFGGLATFGAGAFVAALFALPGIVFACYLASWHMRAHDDALRAELNARQSQSASATATNSPEPR